MTKTITTSYTTLLCLALIMAGAVSAHASEVTGTLSSDTAATAPTGTVSGTVESSNSSGGSGGSSSSGGSRRSGLSNAQTGAVLGASTDSTVTPGFPNAGSQPDTDETLWSTLISFFRSMFSF